MGKYKIVACIVILSFHVRESWPRNLKNDETANDVVRRKRNVEEWTNEECVCFPITETGTRVSKYLPSNDVQERLVVYLYRNRQTNEVTAYIPGQKKQTRFPDLQFDMGDKFDSVVPERTADFFKNAHPTKIVDVAPILHPDEDPSTSSHNMREYNEYNEPPTGNIDPNTLAEYPEELDISEGSQVTTPVKTDYSDRLYILDTPSDELHTPDNTYKILSDKPSFNVNNIVESPLGDFTIPLDGDGIPPFPYAYKPSLNQNDIIESPPGELIIPPDGNNIPSGTKPNYSNRLYFMGVPPDESYIPDIFNTYEEDTSFNLNDLVESPPGQLTLPLDVYNTPNGVQPNFNANFIVEYSPEELTKYNAYNIPANDKPKGSNRFKIPSHDINSPDTSYELTRDKPIFNLDTSDSISDDKTMPDNSQETVNEVKPTYLYQDSVVEPLPEEIIILQNQNIISPYTPQSNEKINKQNEEIPNVSDDVYNQILSVTKGDPSLLTPIPLLNSTNLNFQFNIPGTVDTNNKANVHINTVPNFQSQVKYLPGYIEVLPPPKSNNAVSHSWIEMKEQSTPTEYVNIGFLPGTYTHPTFNGWFNDQIKTIHTNRPSISNAINLSSFRLLLIKALYDNGIQLSKDGQMYDSKGNLLKMSHLQLRPILLGDPMDYEKLIASGKCVIPYNIPYLEAVLVTLVYPPRVLAIIPLGYRNALNSKSRDSLLPTIFEISRSGLSETEESSDKKFDDQNEEILNVSENKANEPINEYESINSDSIKSKNDYSYKSDSDPTMDRRKEKSIILNNHSPESDETINQKTINVATVDKENDENVQTIEDTSRDTVEGREAELIANSQENEPNILNGSNDIEDSKSSDVQEDSSQKPDDDADSLIIRIVGGNPATSSGTPVSSRGR